MTGAFALRAVGAYRGNGRPVTTPPTPPHLTIERDAEWIVATVRGAAEMVTAKALLQTIAGAAREPAVRGAFIDLLDFAVPMDDLDRFFMGSDLAQYWPPVPLAVVGRHPFVDPRRLGEIVARNRGINVRVFTDRDDALAWLKRAAPPGGRSPPPP